MNAQILGEYVDQVYAYAVKRTFSEEEAADLSQEILFTAVKELPGLCDESRFEPWLWGVARNVTRTFRRRMGRQRKVFTYDMPLDLAEEETEDDHDELYSLLRLKISRLSAIYRDIIILYYYDCLSTKAIAGKLHVPEGTVTWRLAEARRKIRKEFVRDMEFDQTALKPASMKIDITGNGNYDGKEIPFPSVFINDALSQNILFHCMEDAKSVEELSRFCGVPAYYIEDRIHNLVKRDAVRESTKGKYITDFWVQTDKYSKYFADHAEKAVAPIAGSIIGGIKMLTKEACAIGYYTAEKSREELFYLCGWLAFEHLRREHSPFPYQPIHEKYDGFRWEYLGDMRTGTYRDYSFGSNASMNSYESGKYAHYIWLGSGYGWHPMMSDNIIDVCVDIICRKTPSDQLSTANAIKDGYVLRRQDGSLFVPTPSFTHSQKEAFNDLTDTLFSPLMAEYSAVVACFAEGYRKLFPKHLKDAADRQCHGLFMRLFNAVIRSAQASGALQRPSSDAVCDVLIENK